MYVLYSHPVSQHCRRVLALLDETGIACDIRHVALDRGEHRAPAYLAINPNHEVPTLVDGAVTIHESNAILRYLCHRHRLTDWYPDDPAARAAVEQWLDWTQCRLGPPVIDVVFNSVFAGESGDPAAIARGRARLDDVLPVLDAALGARDFVAGDAPTIADLAALSSVTHLALADAAPAQSNIVAWVDRMCRLPGVARTLPAMAAA